MKETYPEKHSEQRFGGFADSFGRKVNKGHGKVVEGDS